jgi:hypothetical protein
MSQQGSQEQAIQLQGYHVTQYLHNMMQRDEAILQVCLSLCCCCSVLCARGLPSYSCMLPRPVVLMLLQNFNACRESIMDAVQLYADEQDQALVRGGGDVQQQHPACRSTHSSAPCADIPYVLLCLCLLCVQLGKLRGQFVKLIESVHEVQQHKAALQQLSSSYQPSLEKTDFQDTIQQHIQQAQAGSR